ncbi:chaperone modulator CbpM [Mariprofundus ferrooxydans]|uniref:Bacterial regulatory proteins, MerR family n=1 Tax=Mariprofundus ferrooxydans PV-1 TaxID=314345 RepID=Q0F233_9PROT|nr:chaperone modulator CbpM [Mariprofundus ferrooxydans]EAU55717.1 Bacterial regulatory proteins, MerR family [Mariprofundus ferrooxydans PV-1]KON47880.1 MerR family transcriptional regulator [Mariprofundus ferrooxydans]
MNNLTVLTGIIVEENDCFTLAELSRACDMPAEWILALVEEGVIEPVGSEDGHWQFSGRCLRRVRIIQRLESDLGLNLAGAALALELLEEVESLRNRIAVLER